MIAACESASVKLMIAYRLHLSRPSRLVPCSRMHMVRKPDVDGIHLAALSTCRNPRSYTWRKDPAGSAWPVRRSFLVPVTKRHQFAVFRVLEAEGKHLSNVAQATTA